MKSFLLHTLLKPSLARVGTAAAVTLVHGGQWLCDTLNACGLVTPEGATMVVNYVVAVALVAAELAYEAIQRKVKR